MAELIDTEIQAQLIALEKSTLEFLTDHRQQLESLTRAVLEKETLSSEEVGDVLGVVG